MPRFSGAAHPQLRSPFAAGLASVAVICGATLGAVWAGSAAYAAVTTLYVGGSGCSDTGSGTQSQPYCTIRKAASVATVGQTVLVSGGTYAGGVTVANSGTADNPILFEPASTSSVTITGGANGFVVSGKSYVTIQGFAVTATTSYGIYINNSNHIVVSGNTVTHAGQPASGATAAGIELTAVTASTVTKNASDHNSDHGIFVNGTSSSNLISYNEASFNAEGWQRNANGIDVVGPSNTIIGNVVHDNEDSGLQFYTGGNNNLITLNVTYNNGDHGIDDLNVTGGRIIGNTVYHNCTSGINVEGTSGNYTVENNISVDNAVYPAYNGIACSRRAGNIGIWDSAPPTTTVDNNLVYLSKPGTMYVFGSSYTSLAAMRTATGQEQHGVQANPNFADSTSGDLQLTEGSRAIDSAASGVSGEQSNDILGTARSDDPLVVNTGTGPQTFHDMGAYEFVSTGTQLPPTAALMVTPAGGGAPVAVSADASASSDPGGQPLSYTFDFGDGTTVGPQAGSVAAHTYLAAGTYTASVTVTDTANLTATAQQTVTVTTSASHPAFVSQIATNYSSTSHSSGYVSVWRTQGVAAGDVEILTVQLTGTGSTGSFTGVDDKGNTLSVASDVSNSSGRFAILYGVVHTALGVNDKITVTFPGAAASYRIVGDEVSGVSTVDQVAAAAGTTTSYSSGATGATASPNEFVFGAVGVFSGSTPSWSTGWTAETSYAVGSNFVGRAYKVATSTGSFTASGTTSGNWLATCVTFR